MAVRDPNTQEKMKQFFIPLGPDMDNETPPHLLPKGTMSYLENTTDRYGLIGKRPGTTAIKVFTGKILGYHKVGSQLYALIPVGYSTTGASIYEWDLTASSESTHYTETRNAAASATSATEPFYFTDHFDAYASQCTILTNGLNRIMYYQHHANEAGATPGVTASLMTTAATGVRGKYPVSFYDTLHIAYLTDDIGDGTGASDPYAISISKAGNSRDWENYQSEVRRENGTPITGCKSIGDQILLGKSCSIGVPANDSIWSISAFLNFKSLNLPFGCTNHDGMVITGDTAFVHYNGQVFDITDPATPITEKIQTVFAAEDSGNWGAKGIYNSFNRELVYSIGKKLFVYDRNTKSWRIYSYSNDVKVLGNLAPGSSPASLWLGAISLHTMYSVVEEDLIADYVLQFGDSTLALTNHFNVDIDINGVQSPFTMQVVPPLVSCDDPDNRKRFRKIAIEGTGGPFNVYGYFTDTPMRKITTYSLLGTITLNSKGYGYLNIDKRYVWAGLKFTTFNSGYDELASVCLHYDPKGSR